MSFFALYRDYVQYLERERDYRLLTKNWAAIDPLATLPNSPLRTLTPLQATEILESAALPQRARSSAQLLNGVRKGWR